MASLPAEEKKGGLKSKGESDKKKIFSFTKSLLKV